MVIVGSILYDDALFPFRPHICYLRVLFIYGTTPAFILYNPCTLIFYFILLVYPKSYCYSPYITWLLNENLGNVRRLDFFLSDSLFFFKLTQPFILNNRCTRHCLYNAAALILVQYDVSSQICKLTAKHCCFYMHEKNIKIILFKDRVIPARLTFRSQLFSLYR